MEAEAAVADQPDAAVEALETAVGEPEADGGEDAGAVAADVRTTRYRYRGKSIPTPWEQGTLAMREPALPLERLEGLVAR